MLLASSQPARGAFEGPFGPRVRPGEFRGSLRQMIDVMRSGPLATPREAGTLFGTNAARRPRMGAGPDYRWKTSAVMPPGTGDIEGKQEQAPVWRRSHRPGTCSMQWFGDPWSVMKAGS